MQKILLTLMVALFSVSLVTVEAEAKRLGGGKSLGRSSPSYSRQATPPSAPAAAPRQGAAPRSGASRWLGPLAGLAAGGLLAAMLFGDGFEGFQFLDFILLIALVVGAVMLFKMLRNRSAAQRPTPVGASGQQYAPSGPPVAPEIGSGLGHGNAPPPPPAPRPAWFDEAEFLRAAKSHFIRLQAAWDKGDMEDIREYTTARMFSELTLERQALDNQPQFTEVVNLDAHLEGLDTESGKVVATVRYSGLIREDRDAEPQPFTEYWIIERSTNQADANWYVAGIQQDEDGIRRV